MLQDIRKRTTVKVQAAGRPNLSNHEPFFFVFVFILPPPPRKENHLQLDSAGSREHNSKTAPAKAKSIVIVR